jgi:CcmD family protein
MDPREYNYIFMGFLAAWLIIVAYVASIVLRERRLKRELDRVRRMVEEGGKKA